MKLWFDWLNFTWKRTTGNAKFIIVHEIIKISMKLTLFYEYQKLIQIVKPLRSVCLPLSESFPFSNSKIYNFLVLLLFDGNEMQWCQSCVILVFLLRFCRFRIYLETSMLNFIVRIMQTLFANSNNWWLGSQLRWCWQENNWLDQKFSWVGVLGWYSMMFHEAKCFTRNLQETLILAHFP